MHIHVDSTTNKNYHARPHRTRAESRHLSLGLHMIMNQMNKFPIWYFAIRCRCRKPMLRCTPHIQDTRQEIKTRERARQIKFISRYFPGWELMVNWSLTKNRQWFIYADVWAVFCLPFFFFFISYFPWLCRWLSFERSEFSYTVDALSFASSLAVLIGAKSTSACPIRAGLWLVESAPKLATGRR